MALVVVDHLDFPEVHMPSALSARPLRPCRLFGAVIEMTSGIGIAKIEGLVVVNIVSRFFLATSETCSDSINSVDGRNPAPDEVGSLSDCFFGGGLARIPLIKYGSKKAQQKGTMVVHNPWKYGRIFPWGFPRDIGGIPFRFQGIVTKSFVGTQNGGGLYLIAGYFGGGETPVSISLYYRQPAYMTVRMIPPF